MICPQQCVCQSAHRMDLSISRWVHAIETRQKQQQQQRGHDFMDASESGPSGNEVKIELQIIKRLRVPFKAELTRYTYFFLFSSPIRADSFNKNFLLACMHALYVRSA